MVSPDGVLLTADDDATGSLLADMDWEDRHDDRVALPDAEASAMIAALPSVAGLAGSDIVRIVPLEDVADHYLLIAFSGTQTHRTGSISLMDLGVPNVTELATFAVTRSGHDYSWSVHTNESSYSGTAADPIDEICEGLCEAWVLTLEVFRFACYGIGIHPLLRGAAVRCASASTTSAMALDNLVCTPNLQECRDDFIVNILNTRIPYHEIVLDCSNNASFADAPCTFEVLAGGPTQPAKPSMLNIYTWVNSYTELYGVVYWGESNIVWTHIYEIGGYEFWRVSGQFDVPDWWWYDQCAETVFVNSSMQWDEGRSVAFAATGGRAFWRGTAASNPACREVNLATLLHLRATGGGLLTDS